MSRFPQRQERLHNFNLIDKIALNKIEDYSLIPVNNSSSHENYCNLSMDVVNLFKPYDETDLRKANRGKEKLDEKIKLLMQRSPTEDFITVGKFKLESIVYTKYIDFYFRKFSFDENNSVNDILMYDVIELIESRQNIYD